MQATLSPALDRSQAADWTPEAGELVTALGYTGRVERVDAERGILVRWHAGQGFRPGDGNFLRAEQVRPAR